MRQKHNQLVVRIPKSKKEQVNDSLDAAGFGPNNFRLEAGDKNNPDVVTHCVCMVALTPETAQEWKDILAGHGGNKDADIADAKADTRGRASFDKTLDESFSLKKKAAIAAGTE